MRTAKFLAAVIFLIPAVGLAEGPATEPGATTQPSGIPKEDVLSVTHHSITIADQKLDYTATAGTMVIKDEIGKPRADFFFVAYVKDGEKSESRPITFVFNGGPGAAAVWLHLGAGGPMRVEAGPEGIPGPPPHRLVSNGSSWLDATDLVYIDPIGTGFSRPAEGVKGEEFYGVEQDINSVGDFIRLYLTRNERWTSPKFLAGESYGTTRAAALADRLADRWGIDVNGIILISTVLNFQTLSPADGNDLPYALYVPSYTAIALYHHKLQSDDPNKLVEEAQAWALGPYMEALAKGGNLSKDARAEVVQKLAAYTGLPAELVDEANLRIDPDLFRKRLLEDQKLIIGRYDARVTGLDPHPSYDSPEYDPSASLYYPIYATTFNDYVRRELGYKTDLTYEVISSNVQPWDFGRRNTSVGMGYLDVSGSLRKAMLENPHLKVLVCEGYEDLATPFTGAKYTIDRLDLTDRLRANILQAHYNSGHMIYHEPDSLVKLKQDIAGFIGGAAKGE